MAKLKVAPIAQARQAEEPHSSRKPEEILVKYDSVMVALSKAEAAHCLLMKNDDGLFNDNETAEWVHEFANDALSEALAAAKAAYVKGGREQAGASSGGRAVSAAQPPAKARIINAARITRAVLLAIGATIPGSGVLVAASAAAEAADYQFKDRGEVCFLPHRDGDLAGQFEVNNPISIRVTLPTGCLSSTCTVRAPAVCAAALSGSVLLITSEGSYRDAGGRPCTADCRRLVATCQTPPLPAGTYTVRHGRDGVVFAVPSGAQDRRCIGSAEPG